MTDFNIVEMSPKGRYSKFQKVIGEGAYKVVSQAYDLEFGVYVAWNAIPLGKLNDAQKGKIRDEIHMLVELKQKHPRLLNIHSSWFNKETNTVVFISDLYLSGSLRGFLHNVKQIKVKVMKRWLTQILDGLNFLHQRNIIHRDLKCDNLFFNGTSGDIVIGDFGISRETSTTGNASTILGTPEFMAPEVYDERYTIKSDIYSFGMCVLEIATGTIPYKECARVTQIWRKVTSNVKPEALETVKIPALRDLISRCIRYDHEARPNIEEILGHPFFSTSEHDDDVLVLNGSVLPTPSPPVVQLKTVEDEIEDALKTDSRLEESVVSDRADEKSLSEIDSIGSLEKDSSDKDSLSSSEKESSHRTTQSDGSVEFLEESKQQSQSKPRPKPASTLLPPPESLKSLSKPKPIPVEEPELTTPVPKKTMPTLIQNAEPEITVEDTGSTLQISPDLDNEIPHPVTTPVSALTATLRSVQRQNQVENET